MPGTINKFDMNECMSALQKCVRRGLTEEAAYWAFELDESGFINVAISRLRVIAHEDVGVGDMTAVMFALRALDDTDRWIEKRNGAYRLSLTNAIIALSQATKSRDGDNLQGFIHGKRREGGGYDMIDCARDKHTITGKRMGRGMEHFLNEGVVLDKDESTEAWKLGGHAAFLRHGKALYLEPKTWPRKKVEASEPAPNPDTQGGLFDESR